MLSLDEIEVIKEQAFAGYGSDLNGVCKVYPLFMREILEMGTKRYKELLGILLLTDNDVDKLIRDKLGDEAEDFKITSFEYLLKSAENNDTFLLELEKAFSTFIKEEILLLPKINAVLVGNATDKRLITNENFSDFQQILQIQNKRSIEEPPPENETPYEKKMRKLREQRDAVKRKQQRKSGKEQTLVQLMEIASVFGIDYKNETIFAFYDLIYRHQLKEKWQQDIQMLCAGADAQSVNAKYWGDNSEDK